MSIRSYSCATFPLCWPLRFSSQSAATRAKAETSCCREDHVARRAASWKRTRSSPHPTTRETTQAACCVRRGYLERFRRGAHLEAGATSSVPVTADQNCQRSGGWVPRSSVSHVAIGSRDNSMNGCRTDPYLCNAQQASARVVLWLCRYGICCDIPSSNY